MIDRERLSQMESDFGAEEVRLIVAAFLEEAAAAIAALRAGWSDDSVRLDRLHFLKGCARTIGAMRLGDLCEEFESGTQGHADFSALEREFSAVRDALGTTRLREAG
jgi:HPt (histidine-containing phosphotransfer) domain-containing protein